MEHVERIEKARQEEVVEEFERRVKEQVRFLKQALADGVFENEDFTIGLELEAYAVDNANRHIVPIASEMIDRAPFAPELGMQNLEVNTDPHRFSPEGVAAQASSLEQLVTDTRSFLSQHDMELVLDSIWTYHEEDTVAFLSDVEERDGYIFAENMREDGRYYLLDNGINDIWEEGIPLDVPGADHVLPSVLFESLATSIQPHLKVPDTDDFPVYYNAAIRTLAPLLALSTNSPFLPPDLYNQVDDPLSFVDETFHELRIPIFEQSVNPGPDFEKKKVRFPKDVQSTDDVFEYVANDFCYDPSLRDWFSEEEESFHDRYWEWNYKRKTFWRWVRPVVGGDPVEGACTGRSLRLEHRPLPTQPTIRDVISLQVVTLGLIHGLVVEDHPAQELAWKTAKQDFYRVVDDGFDAEIHWITSEGEETTDTDTLFADVFATVEAGLRDRGFSEEEIEEYVAPIRQRWEDGMTPSIWKKQQVRDLLEEGKSLIEAVHEMQDRYMSHSRDAAVFLDFYR